MLDFVGKFQHWRHAALYRHTYIFERHLITLFYQQTHLLVERILGRCLVDLVDLGHQQGLVVSVLLSRVVVIQGSDHLVGARLHAIVLARQCLEEVFIDIHLSSHRTVIILAWLQGILVEPAAHGIVVEVVACINVRVHQVGKDRLFDDVP